MKMYVKLYKDDKLKFEGYLEEYLKENEKYRTIIVKLLEERIGNIIEVNQNNSYYRIVVKEEIR